MKQTSVEHIGRSQLIPGVGQTNGGSVKTADLIGQAKALRQRIERYSVKTQVGDPGNAAKAQVCDFLRLYAGPKSAFLSEAEAARGFPAYLVATLQAILDSYVEYLEAGLASGVSPERRAQLDVVSDVLGQAGDILASESQHPAAAAMLIGASLEEFLRTWVEGKGLSIGSARPSIDAYAKALRGAELLSKQDIKDITSWAGTRNHAAHGEWAEVSDRHRVQLMLEGVNLFMRQKADVS